MSAFPEYDDFDALGLAEQVRRGTVTAQELLEEAISRVELVNPALNAIAHRLYDRAKAQIRSGIGDGPFAGVPFLLKDLLQESPGVPLENGSPLFKGHTGSRETTLYRRWLKAGLVPFGKTTTPEFGILPVTENLLTGDTRNPWDPSRTPGGSSGGAGALVGARVVPMAAGGDGGGSIRIPSACCGVFGLKPTRARNPVGPFAREYWSGWVSEHVLSVSVRDSAALLDATHGGEPTQGYCAPPVSKPFIDVLTESPRTLRIAYHAQPAMPASVDEDCEAAVRDVAALCKSLGHRVEAVAPEHDSASLGRSFLIVLAANISQELRRISEQQNRTLPRSDIELSTQMLRLMGEAFSAADFVEAQAVLDNESIRLVERYRDYDVVLTPTMARPPIPVGSLRVTGKDRLLQSLIATTGWKAPIRIRSVIDEAAHDTFSFAPFTPLANFTGQPSMSVPLHWNEEGLPIGTMFTSRFGDEHTLFMLAKQLEEARPWRDRRPSIDAGA